MRASGSFRIKTAVTADPLHILKTVYGGDMFRGRQADIIRHVWREAMLSF